MSRLRLVALVALLAVATAGCGAAAPDIRTSGLVVAPTPVHDGAPEDAVLLYRSIEYRGDGDRGSYDLYVPPADSPPPVIVWVHGGGWTSGVRTDIPLLDLLDHGYAIASIDYRFAPEFVHPVAVDDVADAVTHVRTEAARFGIDGDTVVLAGHSSGAHLALLAALTRPTDVVAVVAASTWNDMTVDPDDPDEIEYWGGGFFTAQSAERQVARYLGCSPQTCPLIALSATPSRHAASATMPILLQHGSADDLVPVGETSELGNALAVAGTDVTVTLLSGVGHTAVIDASLLDFLARVTS